MRGILSFFSEVFKRHTEDDAEQVIIVGAEGTTPDPDTLTSEWPRPWLYTRVLLFFLLTTALLFVANVLTNPGQFSNVLVIGAFAVPFTVLVFVFEFNVFRNISFYTVLKALFIGGSLSIITTAVLPSFWFHGITSVTDAIAAGVGEEIAKLLVVYWILKRNRAYPYILNGLLIGAAVGAGFAIFETAGYGMVFFIGGDNSWIGKESMTVLALRNFLAPGGHVVWAAISGAGLLMAARREPLSAMMLRRKPFLVAFSVSVTLHVLWDIPFFESSWRQMGFLLVLSAAAWITAVWFMRSGIKEVDTLRAVVPYRQGCVAARFPLAGPWRRYVARFLDQMCSAVVLGAVLHKAAGYFGLAEKFGAVNEHILTIAMFPLLLLLESVIYEIFGTTPGKWLFSVRVVDGDGNTVSTGVYFRRLLRLWVSGLGLMVPVVTLVLSVMQYRRLRVRGLTTYDEAMGLRVAKGRIHPLRWIAFLPVFLAAGLLLLAGVLAGEEVSDGGNPAKTADARIVKVLDASELKYRSLENGIVTVEFEITSNRTQVCIFRPETLAFSGKEFAHVCSLVAKRESFDDGVLAEALSENAARGERMWCTMDDTLALRILVPLTVSPKTLRESLVELAKEADGIEDRLTGKDDF